MLLNGRALAAHKRVPEADRVLRGARSAGDGLGHRRILWEILAELARIVGAEERAKLQEEARGIVQTIADTLGGDLKASFIARPDVRELLSGP